MKTINLCHYSSFSTTTTTNEEISLCSEFPSLQTFGQSEELLTLYLYYKNIVFTSSISKTHLNQ